MSRMSLVFALLLSSLLITNCGGFDSNKGSGRNGGAGGGGGGGGGGEIPVKCDGTMVLSWQNPTHNTDGSVLTNLAGIRIYYGSQSRTYSTILEHTNTAVQTLTITNLPDGVYYVSATAFNTLAQESDYSGEGVIQMSDCATAFVNVFTGDVQVIKKSE